MSAHRYCKDPDLIYSESFARARASASFDGMTPEMANVVVRLIHACGMPDIVDDLDYSIELVERAVAALLAGCPVFCDCEMVASGITRRFLPAQNKVIVTLNDPRVEQRAKADQTTRSAAAIDLWGDDFAGAVIAIGNAPTALFRLLECIEAGASPPAAILGFPVGFVGAAESKLALTMHERDFAFLALHGTRGGSALAAAAVNALALVATS